MSDRTYKVRPSEVFPRYFALETGADTPTPAPVVGALDELADGILSLVHCKAASVIPRHFDADQQATVLRSLGFNFESLDLQERARFHELLPALMKFRGMLKSLRLLGDLYFREIALSRGRPFRRDRALPARDGRYRLSDGTDRKNTVFVRLIKDAGAARTAEFVANCSLLLPFGFEVLVMPPIAPVRPEDRRISLTAPQRLKGRRL